MKKRIFSLILIFVMVFTSFSVFALEAEDSDSLIPSASPYYAALEALRADSNLNDEDKIHGTVTALLNIKGFHLRMFLYPPIRMTEAAHS